jgi:hypothetical protein
MIYSSIVDTPMIAWHYFYKYYVLHSTLKDEQTILDKIELFKDNALQLPLWQMNLRMCKTMQANKESYLDACFGCLVPGINYSEIACENRSKKSKEKNKQLVIDNFYKKITSELAYKGFKDNSENIELGINLKSYIANLADDKDITPNINYFMSLHYTENFNFTDPQAWVNKIDSIFYENCQDLQYNYPIDIKNISILEFFTRHKYLKELNKKTIK